MTWSPAELLILRKASYFLAVAQFELGQLRFALALKRHNSNQPRVPAGQPGGGQWTDGDGGWFPRAEYAQLRPRARPGGLRRVGERDLPTTPAQEVRWELAAARANVLVREVQRHDPSWTPGASIYGDVEGRIRAYESEAQQAAARLRKLGVRTPVPLHQEEALQSGGRLFGWQQGRASERIRTCTREDFTGLLEAVSPGAQRLPPAAWIRRSLVSSAERLNVRAPMEQSARADLRCHPQRSSCDY